MEWVETTGKTIEEARDQALDELGVAETDAEIEIVEEPRAGLFGRTRGNARVKARVRPTAPRQKQERRRRNGKGSEGRPAGGRGAANGSGGDRTSQNTTADSRRRPRSDRGARTDRSSGEGSTSTTSTSRAPRPPQTEERDMMPEAEQREAGESFLNGLVESFGVSGTVSSALDDEGILSFEIDGDGLGLLIGPGLGTLESIQEVCRNAIQRQAAGREYGKVTLEVAGARAQRKVALEEFVRTEATRVLEDGDDVIFDVMSRSDRKVVHDVIAEFDDLATESVGEDPRRRVVLRQA